LRLPTALSARLRLTRKLRPFSGATSLMAFFERSMVCRWL